MLKLTSTLVSAALVAGLISACASSNPSSPPAAVVADPSPAPEAPSDEPEAAAPNDEATAPGDEQTEAPAAPSPAAPAKATTAKPSAAKPVAAAPAASAAPAYTGPNPCTHAVGGKGIIDQACGRGGIKEAKAVMKDMVKKAKKQGVKFDCDTCHKDETDWSQFTAEAKDRFKELLALYQK